MPDHVTTSVSCWVREEFSRCGLTRGTRARWGGRGRGHSWDYGAATLGLGGKGGRIAVDGHVLLCCAQESSHAFDGGRGDELWAFEPVRGDGCVAGRRESLGAKRGLRGVHAARLSQWTFTGVGEQAELGRCVPYFFDERASVSTCRSSLARVVPRYRVVRGPSLPCVVCLKGQVLPARRQRGCLGSRGWGVWCTD